MLSEQKGSPVYEPIYAGIRQDWRAVMVHLWTRTQAPRSNNTRVPIVWLMQSKPTDNNKNITQMLLVTTAHMHSCLAWQDIASRREPANSTASLSNINAKDASNLKQEIHNRRRTIMMHAGKDSTTSS